jgi:outer membrane lipoprotein-sorting protein
MRTSSCILVALVLSLFGRQGVSQEATGKTGDSVPTVADIRKMSQESMKKVKDYTGKMIKYERFDNEVKKTIYRFKFAKPFKVYLKFLEPHEGREVIYKKGWNDGELRVHKGSFPDITVNLDPQGGMAMDDNHHPITDFGFGSLLRKSGLNMRRAKKRNEGDFKVSDGGTLFGKQVWKIEARFPKGGYWVTAKDDETLWDIAKREQRDMYMIMYNNKDYDDPDDPDEGDKVFIPRYYGSRSEFNLEKGTGTPVKITTWDFASRLYESYEYHDVKFNVGLKALDFDPDNPAYDF